MSREEKSVLIGHWRNGCDFELIGLIMGISESYAKMIVKEYIQQSGQRFIQTK